MTEELQTEEAVTTEEVAPELQAGTIEATDTEETVTPEGSGSAPDNADEHEKITFSEEQQKVFDKAIGRSTRKAKDAERELETLRQQLEEAKSQIPEAVRPVVPDLPDDRYDDDYEEKVKARDAAIVEAARFDALQEQQKAQQEYQKVQTQREQIERVNANAETYAERAKTLNVPNAELQLAAIKLSQAGMTPELAGEITGADQGPLITLYLAENPSELGVLNQLSGDSLKRYMAAAVIPSVKPPKVNSSAPAPADPLKGSGAQAEHPALKGVIFE